MQFIRDFILRKLQETSTWAGIVTFACGAIGWNASPEVQQQIVAVALPIVSLLLMLINERKGPNPNNAPKLPSGDVPVIVRSDHGDAAELQPPAAAKPVDLQPDTEPHLQPRNRADLPPDQRGNDVDPPRPVRPGFNNSRG